LYRAAPEPEKPDITLASGEQGGGCAVRAEPRRKGAAKKFARNNGLVVQLGEAEEFHASGKGGCAERRRIMVSLWERSP